MGRPIEPIKHLYAGIVQTRTTPSSANKSPERLKAGGYKQPRANTPFSKVERSGSGSSTRSISGTFRPAIKASWAKKIIFYPRQHCHLQFLGLLLVALGFSRHKVAAQHSQNLSSTSRIIQAAFKTLKAPPDDSGVFPHISQTSEQPVAQVSIKMHAVPDGQFI